MSGECKSYRLNEPMSKAEFCSMPDDLKITYIKLIRNKYGTPDNALGAALCLPQQTFAKIIKNLGLSKGKGKRSTSWDKEGFYAWWHGVDKLSAPATEEVDEEPILEEQEAVITSVAPEVFVEDDLPVEEPDYVTDELNLEINFLKAEVNHLRMVNEELVAVNEKDEAEIGWLRNECDNLRMNARILEAQMEVVRMIFGGMNRG